MENLNIKVHEDKVSIEYISLENAEESFYEEFGLRDYQKKIDAFKENYPVELDGLGGKLKLVCIGENTQMTYLRPGRDVSVIGKNLCRKFLI